MAGSTRLIASLCLAAALAAPARADIAVVGIDNHSENVNGATKVPQNPPPDLLQIVDLAQFPPKLLGRVEVPVAVPGPPMAVAVGADESFAIVAAAHRVDAQKPTDVTPDNRISVVDLTSSPPKLVQQVIGGSGPCAVAISPDGSLVLVSNRFDGTMSIFTLKAKRLEAAGTIEIGNAQSLPSGIVFSN